MTYKLCKQIITNKTYTSKEDMQLKLDVFFTNNRINEDEYVELTNLLATH